MVKNGGVIATTSQCARPFCLPSHLAFPPCELNFPLQSSLLSSLLLALVVLLLSSLLTHEPLYIILIFVPA